MHEPDQTAPRYAVYYAPPPGSPWHEFGRLWLSGHWRPAGVPPQTWPQRLQAPARYGFHATLKAPFRLAPGGTEEALLDAVAVLAGTLQPVALGPMEPVALQGYVALAPEQTLPALCALAARCVRELDHLRAPLNDAEWAHRRREPLDARAMALLQAHGYPHVLERFRFHLTLASVADAGEAARVVPLARELILELQRVHLLHLDRLCVFVERSPGQAFERLHDFELKVARG
jgi:Protein of unknown function (DUF1045)